MIKRIIAAIDGSSDAARAVSAAADIAELSDAELDLLHVIPTHASAKLPKHLKAYDAIEHASKTQEDVLRDAAEQILGEARASIVDRDINVTEAITFGDPAAKIVQHYADRALVARAHRLAANL